MDFVDLGRNWPMQAVDEESTPRSLRGVTLTGYYGEEVVAEVGRHRPSLVVHDTFSVIGDFVANQLGIPHVNICAGHNVKPEVVVAGLHRDGVVRVSGACREAAARLETAFSVPDAHPFMYVFRPSRYLNIYCEPPRFIDPDHRDALDPVAFFGSVPEDWLQPPRPCAPVYFPPSANGAPRLFVSFGTVVWRLYPRLALETMMSLSDALETMPHVRALMSLGGARDLPSDAVAALSRPNVTVRDLVDQRRALIEADLFLTHHGLNSTHEAIVEQVPMISYPFFWDQPDQARHCERLGVALPLTRYPRRPVRPDDLKTALEAATSDFEGYRSRCRVARAWEVDTIRRRSEVIDRVMALT